MQRALSFKLRALFHFTLFTKVIYDSSFVVLTKLIPEIKKMAPKTPYIIRALTSLSLPEVPVNTTAV